MFIEPPPGHFFKNKEYQPRLRSRNPMTRSPPTVPITQIGDGLAKILKNATSYCEAAVNEFENNRFGPSHVLILFAIDEMGKFYGILDRWRATPIEANSISLATFYNHSLKIQRMLDYHDKILQSGAFATMREIAEGFGSREDREAYETVSSNPFRALVASISNSPKVYRESAIYADYKDGKWMEQQIPPRELLRALIKLVSGDAKSYLLLLNQEGVNYLKEATWLS